MFNKDYNNSVIEAIKNYLKSRIEKDGKVGKDLTLEYILDILEEAKI